MGEEGMYLCFLCLCVMFLFTVGATGIVETDVLI